MKKLRIAVFASGSGSNFQAIADRVRDGSLQAELRLLVCDRPGAYVIERAKQAEVPTFTFRPKDYATREQYEAEILQRLQEEQIDLIVLAGYMRIITSTLVEPFYGKMINIHPSLLPAFPGVNGIGQAFEYGVKVTGATVHFVDGGMDTGPIIAQKTVEIAEGETLESLEQRIHQIEHQLYPQAIQWISEGKVHLNGRKVDIRQ
jgi:phosphoribosylglycinamide formyltransferase-1